MLAASSAGCVQKGFGRPSDEPAWNFQFLAEHSPLLAELGVNAERLFPFDPASCAE